MVQSSQLLAMLSQALGGRTPRTIGSLAGADEERTRSGRPPRCRRHLPSSSRPWPATPRPRPAVAAAAPLVLAALGRMQRQRGLDATGMSTLLGSERQRLASSAPGLMGLASRVLDSDGDGDVDADDLAGVTGAVGRLLRDH